MTRINLSRNQLRIVICLVLTLATAGLYWPILHHGFICFDDDAYVVGNRHVTEGLTWSGVVWAFQSGYAANWHPLTWISHMLDCQLYGLQPGGHHLTNLLLHIANTVLLFIWLSQSTQTVWRSALVAALFAWHPTHVESVAWASERKDVLCAFFWMLTLLAYTHYAQRRSRVKGRGSKADTAVALDARLWPLDYALALFFFACGLMSKPMAVTLPFVLLLLDYWPLQRFNRSTIPRLILEKLPFFALALAGSIITYLVQKSSGAVLSSEILSLPQRLENVPLAYVRYLAKNLWPSNLAMLYPYHAHHSAIGVIGAVLLLAAVTGLLVWRAQQNPYGLFGWLWFLGTLVPTIGIVQVGSQSIADRYLYLPGIGLFILMAWAANDILRYHPRWRPATALAGTAALAGCLACTRIQLGYWQNNIALLSHTIAVTTDNYTIYNSLGAALELAGQKDEAFLMYARSVQIEPRFAESQFNLGTALLRRGWPEKAGEHLAAAVKLAPDSAKMRYSYGVALANTNQRDDARAQFTEAVRLDPGYADAHGQLALIYRQQGKTNDALDHFSIVVRLQPDNPEARFNFGLALLDAHQPAAAADQFAEELRLTPDEAKAHYRLAQALQRQNQPAEAARHYREALRLTPEFPEAKNELNEILAAHPELR